MWAEHWPALELFLSLRTQWRIVAGMNGTQHQGLDYTALYGHPRFARLEFDEQDTLLAQIQHIETGALGALNNNPMDDTEERKRLTDAIAARHAADVEALLNFTKGIVLTEKNGAL